ncbi:PASTA domain-containing protein [Pseudarthrobacter sp. BRE9]|uniref:PASTA domain-containing protein n=1 Tax=Pseudarthrobacter sp. BRE9 TaxID=2962582 RepID=UPI0037C974D3
MLNVPDLVGQPVHIAQETAANLGFGLAAGDPDGPGLRSRTWPGLFWVTSQDPPAGSVLERGEPNSDHLRSGRSSPKRRAGADGRADPHIANSCGGRHGVVSCPLREALGPRPGPTPAGPRRWV